MLLLQCITYFIGTLIQFFSNNLQYSIYYITLCILMKFSVAIGQPGSKDVLATFHSKFCMLPLQQDQKIPVGTYVQQRGRQRHHGVRFCSTVSAAKESETAEEQRHNGVRFCSTVSAAQESETAEKQRHNRVRF